jgi:NAD(P)-dependent dehydrogenase (short-subunit alcohol dehydrogenase family)
MTKLSRTLSSILLFDITLTSSYTVSKYGKLDIFFANAGVQGGFKMEDITPDAFMRTMKINTLSVFLAIKHASAQMSSQGAGGSIIATASVAGIRAGAGGSDYSASKAAVINLVQTSAWQLTGTNIRGTIFLLPLFIIVNALCPGLIETGMTAPVFDMARARGTSGKIGQLNPTRRGGVADEIARVACFLASDDASYVNGQAWAVDGGLSASLPVVPGKIA